MTNKLTIFGNHDDNTIAQMQRCLEHDDAIKGALCADGHLGYSQPVGAAIAYREHVSVSGVGYDIACGNMAVRLDMDADYVRSNASTLARQIREKISFGVGRANNTLLDAPFINDSFLWEGAGALDLRDKARSQLGTVGSGNHYVDVFADEQNRVWIGVHFGSRGLGHTLATRFLKAAGGKDGINEYPTLVEVNSDLGTSYLMAMNLAGQFAYAGREWVVDQVRKIISADSTVLDTVHNHHNFCWTEDVGGSMAFVVRKGCTPAQEGQRGFIGGSMGDNAVIVTGRATGKRGAEKASALLRSTVHGAGRIMGRRQAKKTFTREEMDAWLAKMGVTVIGGDLDESPMAYRRLAEVLDYHQGTIEINHTLKPLIVLMAGSNDFDPWKD
jgi:tRNA-splicing ligase RtcB